MSLTQDVGSELAGPGCISRSRLRPASEWDGDA